MKIGLMYGSDKERGRNERLAGLIEDVSAAEQAGFTSVWIPQVPGYLDAMTAIAVVGQATSKIEIGTAVVPIQTRHPIPMAQQALTTQLACDGRFTLGLGPSHHWIIEDQLGLPYERPAHLVRNYLEVLNGAFEGPGSVDVENDSFKVHSPMNVTEPMAMPILLAALAPLMLKIAGERAQGTILWMADEKAVAGHIAPKVTKAASDAGRPAPRIVAGVPIILCAESEADAARSYAADVLGHAELSPNYERLLEHGDADDVSDVMAVGGEALILERLRRFKEAGVTDFAARVVGIGETTEERMASKRRTEELLSSLCPEL
jgi:F420-dependent oxidoreductase-like protein